MRKEENLNTMNSFANGFKIMRDGKAITLTPEEMSDFRFFDKAIEGRDNLYTYGCNKAKSQEELDAVAELASDPTICRSITVGIEDTLYENVEEIMGIHNLRLKSKKKKLFVSKSLSRYHEPLNVNIV